MKKRILCFGDSNTWGAVPGESSRYEDNVRWTGVLQNLLGEEYQVIEEGYNGRTSVFDDPVENRLSGIRYFETCCDSQSPLDLIIVMLGTNDLKLRFGVEARTIAYGFEWYLNTVKTAPMAGEKPKFLLVSPILISETYKNHELFHDMFGEHAAERSKRFAEAYGDFAREHDIAFLDAAQYGEACAKDGVHMDAESHQRLGTAIAKKVTELLK